MRDIWETKSFHKKLRTVGGKGGAIHLSACREPIRCALGGHLTRNTIEMDFIKLCIATSEDGVVDEAMNEVCSQWLEAHRLP